MRRIKKFKKLFISHRFLCVFFLSLIILSAIFFLDFLLFPLKNRIWDKTKVFGLFSIISVAVAYADQKLTPLEKKYVSAKKAYIGGLICLLVIIILLLNAPEIQDKDYFTCSMFHEPTDFDSWWQKFGKFHEEFDISKEDFKTFPYPNGFTLHFGTVKPVDTLKRGDLIAYINIDGTEVIHRLVNISSEKFFIKSDNNPSVTEIIPKSDATGKVENCWFSPLLDFFIDEKGCRIQP